MKNNNEWWYSLPDSTREYLFITDMDTFWDASESDIVWEGLSESKKTEIRNAIERNPGDEISVKYALDLPGKYRSGYYLEKEIIQNQYDGKTPEEVWNAWTEDQRTHFIKDHFDEINRAGNSEGIQYGTWISASNLLEKQSYSELSRPVKQILLIHTTSGQYGKGGEVEKDELQEAAEFLMDKTVFSYSLGQLEATEHKIKGVHITPKHFNQRHLYFSFYGNEWPHNFNDYDRLTADQLGDFIAGEEVELKDSQGEPYIVALGEIAGKGTKIPIQIKGGLNGRQILVDLADGNDARLVKISDSWFDNDRNNNLKIKEGDWDVVLSFNESSFSDFINGEKISATNKHGQAYKIMLLKNQFGKGTKIENMENKNYYYLKIGNRIIETFGGFSMTGSTKGGQYIYEIIGHSPSGVIVKEHTITKSKKTEPFEIRFYDLTKYMNAEAKGYQVEGCPMENMRDEALLDMEIADIKNSFKIEEEKAEVRKKEEEVAQAKHEADILLKKATDTEAAAKDTIEAMALLTVKKNTEDAYMRDTYGNKAWEIAIKELGKLGFSKDQIEWILNSKYMRWASDEYKSPNGRLKGTEIIQFYHSHGFMDDNDKQIVPANAKAGKGKKVGGEEYLNKSHGGFKYKVWKNGDKYYIDPEFLTEVTKTQDYKDVVYFDTTKEAVDYAEKAIDERKAGKGTKVGEFGKESVNRILNKALLEYEKETGNKLFKKEAKIGKYYHFRLNNPKGVKKCATPSWASDLAGSVYEGAKITTCQKDGEWFAQNVMIPTKNISKLQARSYAQQIAIKIKK